MERTTAQDRTAVLFEYQIHQATGMIVAQLDLAPDEALRHLQTYAAAHSVTTLEAASDVIARRISFS